MIAATLPQPRDNLITSKIAHRCLGFFFLLLVILFSLLNSGPAHAEGDVFYWKTSKPRDLGVVKTQHCPTSSQQIEASGTLCYEPAKPGYSCGGTTECVMNCPQGYKDGGVKGATYLCQYDGPHGSIYTPGTHWESCVSRTAKICTIWGCAGNLCVGGYRSDGCDKGFHLVGLSCQKDTPPGFSGTGGNPIRPKYSRPKGEVPLLGCPSDHPDESNGTCYHNCPKGYHGVGPVCWGNAPSGYTDCGLGVASNIDQCVQVTANQLISTGSLAFDLYTGVGASAKAKAKAAFDGRVRDIAVAVTKANKKQEFIDASVKLILESGDDVVKLANELKSSVKALTDQGTSFERVVQRYATSNNFVKTVGAINSIYSAIDYPVALVNGRITREPDRTIASVRMAADSMSALFAVVALFAPPGVDLIPATIGDALGVLGAFSYPVAHN